WVGGAGAEGRGRGVAGDECHVGAAPAPDVTGGGREHRLGEVAGDDPRRHAGERERRVPAAGRHVENARASTRGAPGAQTIEILAARVQRARDVGVGACAELLLYASRVVVAHFGFVRSARWRSRKSASSGDRSNGRDASSTSLSRLASG